MTTPRLHVAIELIEAIGEYLDSIGLSAADFYQQDANKIKQVQTQITDLEKSLESAFEKWEKLEALQNA